MEEKFICQYCGKTYKNNNSLIQHKIRCTENPNRIKPTKSQEEWNTSEEFKNILKEATDRRIQRQMKEAFVENSKASNCAINNYLKNYLHWDLKCSNCGLSEWQGEKIPLEIHHINGNNSDNRLENLTYLCLNCHAITDNFRGRNINCGKQKVSDEDLIESIKNSDSIRQALINVGLTPKGGNYTRAYRLLSQITLKNN